MPPALRLRSIEAIPMNEKMTDGRWYRVRAWFDRGGWTHLWAVTYLATLACAAAAVLVDGDVSSAKRATLGTFALLEAGWYLLIAVRWRYWEASTARFVMLMAVAAALWLPLVVGHPTFWWTVWAAYGVAACPWLRRSLATVTILTALLVLADHLDGTGATARGVATTVGIGAMVLLAHATMGAIGQESERRRRLIVELEATRAELAASERTAGAMAERERLARDIHDALAQGFTSIVMLLEAVDAKLPADGAEARAPLDQALQTARDSLADARRIVWDLGRGGGQPGALVASLERLAERTSASGDVDVEVVITGDSLPLDARRELAVLRTAQEAVSNARRHANATRITVTVSWLGDAVVLDVADEASTPTTRRPAARAGSG